jgi:hypothetical protein
MKFSNRNHKKQGININAESKSFLKILKTNSTILILLISLTTYAQQGINYQGVARNSEGEVMIDSEITLTLNINKITADGETVYTENHNPTTDSSGVFSIVIGQGTPSLNIFQDINWAENQHFLNVWLDGEEIGTTELMSVPYTQAIGKWQAHQNGVTPKGTGGSIYIGDNAGESDDFTDNSNIGLGINALQATSFGHNNVAIGYEPLMINRDGHFNIGIGSRPLYNNISGASNIALGPESLYSNTSGSGNIALGQQSLHSNTSGAHNISFGHLSLYQNNGSFNVAAGYRALSNNDTGENNIAFGTNALYQNTVGIDNISLGFESLYNNTNGFLNIALGKQALYSNTTGSSNIANGLFSLYNNTTGSGNIANGNETLKNNETGEYNVAIGLRALYSNTEGSRNIAAGQDALYSNTSGTHNIAMGHEALYSNTNGVYNFAAGSGALSNNTSGYRNIAVGYGALRLNTTSTKNVAIGTSALAVNVNGGSNVAIGDGAGIQSLGSYNIFIGDNAGWSETGSNKLYIESSMSSNPLIYGDFSLDYLGFNAKVGIGTHTPELPLQIVDGTDVNLEDGSGQMIIGTEAAANLVMDSNEIQARNNGAVSDLNLQAEGGNVRVGGAIVHASDRRLKRDIEDISYGLKDLIKLEPKEYFWKGKEQEFKSLGLIAQDVDDVIKNIVTYDKEQDRYGVSYTELIPVLIKAIQEQQLVIETQQKRNNRQSKELSELASRIEIMESKVLQLN